VLAESLEDIFLLSLGDVLVAQGSSHFSTLTSLLVWARTGCFRADERVLFLDQDAIDTGVVPTSFLEAMNMLNSTYGLDPALVEDAGIQRWMLQTNMFFSGLVDASSGARSVPADVDNGTDEVEYAGDDRITGVQPWLRRNIFMMDSLLPRLNDEYFYRFFVHYSFMLLVA
jgi:hypothetical protein